MHVSARSTRLMVVFLLSYLLLFAGMSLRPGMYDEGIMLTAALRVAAGQVPHRDFYFIYGPAEAYLLAGLFKVFGNSLLVERLFDLLIKALLVTSMYALLSAYCRKSLALIGSMLTMLWLFSMSEFGLAITPVSLLNLVGSALVLPVFTGSISRRRLLAAGAVSGAAFLFRYDTGVALLGIHLCLIALAVLLRTAGLANRLQKLATTCWPYLLGFALLTVPAALCYLSVAPLAPWMHDIILYPRQYYYRSRNLPFPKIDFRGLENLEIYLPIVIAGMSLYCVLAGWSSKRGKGAESEGGKHAWQGVLITFTFLLVIMYLKGLVRVGLVQMYLAIIPSIVLVAVLFEHRSVFARPAQLAIGVLLALSALTATWSSLHAIRLQQLQHASLAENLTSARQKQAMNWWCRAPAPLTRGLCFLPDNDRMQAFAFINSHTHPGDSLYSGLQHHDRIVANDDLVYFATQSLPATRWSHLDPNLQTRLDIQKQMVAELSRYAPRFVEVDAEFDLVREPNDSGKSSGVTLLDDYIQNHYAPVATFGAISVWQRRTGS